MEKNILGRGNRPCKALSGVEVNYKEILFFLSHLCLTWIPRAEDEKNLPEAGPKEVVMSVFQWLPMVCRIIYTPWDAHRYPHYLDFVSFSRSISQPFLLVPAADP